MPHELKYIEQKTKGTELKLPCVSCSGKTTHKVVASFDERGSHETHHDSFDWGIDNQIVQCLGCQCVSFRIASWNSEELIQDFYDQWGHVVTEKLYPSRLVSRKGLKNHDEHLPSKVQKIYDETLSALASQSPILAGIGLRALLETVCKEKSATGKDLLEKIDSLVHANILTPTAAAILHKIRTLGNAAAHEVKPHSERQLGLAMDIIEHLLLDVYILPKQVESAF
jgi:hypothetical protein